MPVRTQRSRCVTSRGSRFYLDLQGHPGRHGIERSRTRLGSRRLDPVPSAPASGATTFDDIGPDTVDVRDTAHDDDLRAVPRPYCPRNLAEPLFGSTSCVLRPCVLKVDVEQNAMIQSGYLEHNRPRRNSSEFLVNRLTGRRTSSSTENQDPDTADDDELLHRPPATRHMRCRRRGSRSRGPRRPGT